VRIYQSPSNTLIEKLNQYISSFMPKFYFIIKGNKFNQLPLNDKKHLGSTE